MSLGIKKKSVTMDTLLFRDDFAFIYSVIFKTVYNISGYSFAAYCYGNGRRAGGIKPFENFSFGIFNSNRFALTKHTLSYRRFLQLLFHRPGCRCRKRTGTLKSRILLPDSAPAGVFGLPGPVVFMNQQNFYPRKRPRGYRFSGSGSRFRCRKGR